MSRNNEREFDGGEVELDMTVRTFGKLHRTSWSSVPLIHQMLSEMETWLHCVWIGCVVFGVRRGYKYQQLRVSGLRLLKLLISKN